MKIEAVTVSVGFSDILAHTLPMNIRQFNRIVVVTDTNDLATKKLCEHHYVECIQTDAFYANDHAFNKGRGINAGLRALYGRSPPDWIVHMDADIVLPVRTRHMLDNVCALDPEVIYGIDRLMCPDFEAWVKHLSNPVLQHVNEIFVIPDAFPVGVRVAKLDGEGYMPIGFFQLWSPDTAGVRWYPEEHGTAGRADMLHALNWPRGKRALIPEIFGIHLGSPIAAGTNNWRGRRSLPFGPVRVVGDVTGGKYD